MANASRHPANPSSREEAPAVSAPSCNQGSACDTKVRVAISIIPYKIAPIRFPTSGSLRPTRPASHNRTALVQPGSPMPVALRPKDGSPSSPMVNGRVSS